eukprot:FR741735.1.p1 GENE.FR741735.1~~FR741735.1.p1  ORF type:complete len:252 (+),score=12.76 FR741735.1:77-757(+)
MELPVTVTYLDDDLFSGSMRTWSDEKKILRDVDTGTQLSCDVWDDDSVYPTGKCSTGDMTQCKSLTEYSQFGTLCESACSTTNMTWGVPCAWEVISKLDQACDTIYNNASNFTQFMPNASKNLGDSYYSEYKYNVASGGGDYVPYAFNASIDSTNWDDCNVHGFCYSCVDDDAETNDYCKAVISRYDTIYSASALFTNFEYWCGEVDNIKNGRWNYTGGHQQSIQR